jgi:hypothetical protein
VKSRADIIGTCKRAHADATIEKLPLDAVGHVPHWPAERDEVTLHRTRLHVIAETQPARRPGRRRP